MTQVSSRGVGLNSRVSFSLRSPYLQCYEHRADMDGKVQDGDDHADDQVGLQPLVLRRTHAFHKFESWFRHSHPGGGASEMNDSPLRP